MKLVLLILFFAAGILQAQNIKVVRTEKLTNLNDGEFVVSAVSPDGKLVLASEPGYRGLYSIDINLRNITKISEMPGAGYEPCFSPDGSSIFFRTNEFKGSMKYSSLIRYDLGAHKMEILESEIRNLSSPVFSNSHLVYSVNGARKERDTGYGTAKSESGSIYVILENLTPILYINGISKPFTPAGEGNYIWVSLSPDKTKLLYNFIGTGTYICRLDGTIIAEAGRLNAPQWLNNQVIVGMDDKDDGYRVLSSDIVCYSLITKLKSKLTSTADVCEMYPVPFPAGDKIVYQTLKGELFIMSLTIK